MKTLRLVLRSNALSCLVFGAAFLVWPQALSDFVGNAWPLALSVIGAVLLFNGVHLLLAASRPHPKCGEILYFVGGDFAWVLGTVILIALGVGITSPTGIFCALGVAFFVGFLGWRQFAEAQTLCLQKAI